MSVEDIAEYLQSRDVPPQVLETLRTEKIDADTVLSIDDERLAGFVPRLGDRVALRNFCLRNQQPKHKTTKRSNLFDLLKSKISRMDNDERTSKTHDSAGSQDCSKGKYERKKTRRIEFGWIHNKKQVRKRLGGGTRKLDVSRKAVKADLLKIGKDLFFPNGNTTKGSTDEFLFDLLDFKETPVPEDITVAECYELFKTGIITFYLHTVNKQTERTHTTTPSTNARQNRVTTRSMKTKPATLTESDKSATSLELNKIIVNKRSLEPSPSTSHSDVTSVDEYSAPISDHSDCDILGEACAAIGGFENDYTLPDITEEEIILNFGLEPDTEMIQNSQEPDVVVMKIHRGSMAFLEICTHFKDPTVLEKIINIERVLSNGEVEQAQDTGGVLKDTLAEFWESFYSQCTVGRNVKVPCLRHDFGPEECRAVGRVLVYGWKTLGYWPVLLSRVFIRHCLYPHLSVSNAELMSSFNEFISSVDKDVFQRSVENFESVDSEELMEALDTHECRTRVNKENIVGVLLEIAHKELLQTPMFVCDCWKEILQGIDISTDKLEKLYNTLVPTNREVARILVFPETKGPLEADVAKYLKRYVKELDQEKLRLFLRYCTGSDLLICDRITVEMIPMKPFERRPIGGEVR